MKLILLDRNPQMSALLEEALSWIDPPIRLPVFPEPEAARGWLEQHPATVILVGEDLPQPPLPTLKILRSRHARATLIAYTRMSLIERERQQCLLAGGADLVVDRRMSAIQWAIILRRYLTPSELPEQAVALGL